MSSSSIQKIDSLTSLRFFAAAALFLFHFGFVFRGNTGKFTHWLHLEFCQGVTFFFVLSGFILTYIYSRQNVGDPKVFFSFIRKRIARLWPLHISTMVLFAVIVPAGAFAEYLSRSFAPILLSTLMLQSLVPFSKYYLAGNSVSWSISTEFVFYLSLPLLLLLMRRSAGLVILATIPFVCAFVFLGNHLGVNAYEWTTGRVSLQGLLYVNPLVRVFDFAFGVVTANLFLKHGSRLHFTWVQATVLEFVSIAICLVTSFFSQDIAGLLGQCSLVGNAGSFWILKSGLSPIAFALLIFIFALQRGAISNFFAKPFWVFLGEISYAMYLCHAPVLLAYQFYFPKEKSFVDYALCILIVFILSHLLHTCIEKPFRRLIANSEWKPGSVMVLARDVLSSCWKDLRFVRKTQLIECFGLMVLLCAVYFQYWRQDVISTSTVTKIMESENAYRKPFVTRQDGLRCICVVPDSEHDTVTFIWRGSKLDGSSRLIHLQLLDNTNRKFADYFQTFISPGRFLRPGEAIACKISAPHLSKAHHMAVQIARSDFTCLTIRGGTVLSKGTCLQIPLKQAVASKTESSL